MTRRRIYLMRHGEVAYFAGDDPTGGSTGVALTPRGREQASAAGRCLAGVRIDRVIASGLPRTLETARLVLESDAGMSDVPEIETWPEFEEFRDLRFDGIAEAEVDEEFLTGFHGVAELDRPYLRGETVGSVVKRVGCEIDRLLAQPDWNTALLVLHGGVNRAVLSRALTGAPAFFGHLEQTPGCLNVLDHGPGWFVRAVNVTPTDMVHAETRATSVEQMAAQYRRYHGFPLS